MNRWLVLIVLLPGCTSGRGARTPALPDASTGAPTLQVLHVTSEHGLGAGFPVDSNHAITAAGLLRLEVFGVVESVPMVSMAVGDGSLPHSRPDWCVLCAPTPRFHTVNLIDSGAAPRSGDSVLLGGFVVTGADLPLAEFWSVEASVIEGRAVSYGLAATAEPRRLWTHVPRRDYRGFIGGPAACVDDAGNLRVWGVIVSTTCPSSGPHAGDTLLGVAPLPPDRSLAFRARV